jgi:Lon protease-like protein
MYARGRGFGVVWLQQGSEVSGGSLDVPNVGEYGTYARIVDWDQLPNGLLGIVIEGQQYVLTCNRCGVSPVDW